MHFNYIFVLTYGRSGSTLLQGVLNSIPGVQIRGENAATLRHLFHAWNAARVAHDTYALDRHKVTSPWYGATFIDLDWYGRDLAATFIRNVLRPSPNATTVGFKEIRYGLALPSLLDEVAFIRRFFPKSAFIVNTRDIEATVESNIRARHAVTREKIEASDQVLRELVTRGGHDIHHVHYDDYRGDANALRPMFDFLGTVFDSGVVQSVFDRRHSG